MYRLWSQFIEPILRETRPRTIVEIGIGSGRNTRHLLEYAREHGAVVHAVDPRPACDTNALARAFAPHVIMHRLPSVEAIPELPPFDAMLVDGDHNWFTVLEELRAVRDHARRHRTAPLLLLHDTGWPYARRDLYYAPERIPEAHRRPFIRGGLRPDSDAPDPEGGMNQELLHAEEESNRRSGVLGAVDEFLEETGGSWTFIRIPGFYGFGMLAPSALLQSRPDIAALFRRCALDPLVERHVDALERDRIEHVIALGELRKRMDAGEGPGRQPADWQRQREVLVAERRRLQDDVRRTSAHAERLEERCRALSAAEDEANRLLGRVTVLEQTLRAVFSTRSWRWTAMLRRIVPARRKGTDATGAATETQASACAADDTEIVAAADAEGISSR